MLSSRNDGRFTDNRPTRSRLDDRGKYDGGKALSLCLLDNIPWAFARGVRCGGEKELLKEHFPW